MPTIGILPSLSVIVGVLAITTVASLRQGAARRRVGTGAAPTRSPTPTAPARRRRPAPPRSPAARPTGIPHARLTRVTAGAAGGAASPRPAARRRATAVIQVNVGWRRRSVGEPGLSSRSALPSAASPWCPRGCGCARRRGRRRPGSAAAQRRSRPAAAPVSCTTAIAHARQLDPGDLGQPGPQRAARRCCRTPRPAVRPAPPGRRAGRRVTQSPACTTTSAASTAAHSGAGRSRARTRQVGVGDESAAAAARPSADPEQVDHEHQRLTRLDHAARAAVAVAQVRRDHELAPAADLHARHALVPAADHPAGAEREAERRAAVPRGVELLAGGVRDARRSAR